MSSEYERKEKNQLEFVIFRWNIKDNKRRLLVIGHHDLNIKLNFTSLENYFFTYDLGLKIIIFFFIAID